MKTLKYLFACILVLSIAIFAMPASAANPHIEAFDDAVQQFGKGYIVRPTGDQIGVLENRGTTPEAEIVRVTQDTKNLENVIEMIEPGETIKLVGGDYYISKVIICRKSINIIGAGMNHTILHAKGGNDEPYPLMTRKEADDNYPEDTGIRAPVVFRFSADDDSREIKVLLENLTVRTEGEAEKWYRIHGPNHPEYDPDNPSFEEYTTHMGVIIITGDNFGEIDYDVSRVDAKFKNVKIQGVLENTPRAGILVVPGGKVTLLDTPGEGEDDGLDFHLEAVEYGNGAVEVEGCVFEHIKSYPLLVMGISSLPLPDQALMDLPNPDYTPIPWDYLPESDWTPGIVKITGTTFDDNGYEPCAYSGWISNIVVWDLSAANLSITNNSFLNTTGMVAVIAGGLTPVSGGGDLPQPNMPLPYPSACSISNNQMQFNSTGDVLGFDFDGMFLADFGPLAAKIFDYPSSVPENDEIKSLKTLDVNISGNKITFYRPTIPPEPLAPASAILGLGLCDALIENNDIEGIGLTAIAMGVAELHALIPELPHDPPELFPDIYDPAIDCTLLKNKVDNFTAFAGAPILLGCGSSNCTVIGWGIDPPVNVIDIGSLCNPENPNNLVDVQTATGGELGEAIREIKSPRFPKF